MYRSSECNENFFSAGYIYAYVEQNSFKLYFQAYLSKVHLRELMTDIQPYAKDGLQSAKALYEQMDTLVKENLPPMTQVKDKTADYKYNLYPPLWFAKNTKLCWRWDYPEYYSNGRNYHNCPTHQDHEQCALPNTMTPFKDLIFNRPRGCDYKWIINSSHYDPWFAKVKLCFKHVKTSDRTKPCSPHNQHRDSCQPLGMFTPHVFIRNGISCYVHWKIVIPSDAPVWASKLKLCIKRKRGNYSCGGKLFDDTVCTKDNEWTPLFGLALSSRSNLQLHCRLQWGLYTF